MLPWRQLQVCREKKEKRREEIRMKRRSGEEHSRLYHLCFSFFLFLCLYLFLLFPLENYRFGDCGEGYAEDGP